MDDKKRNITGSYPGKGEPSKAAKSRNPFGSYPGKGRVIPKEEPKVQEPTLELGRIFEKQTAPQEEMTRAFKPLEEEQIAEAIERENRPEAAKPKRKKFRLPENTLKRYGLTLVYYTCILLVSVVLAAWLCHVGNEVLGLIRPDKELTVEIPEKSSVAQISKELKKADVIDHPFVFQLYCKLKGAGSKFQSGEITLNCKSDYNQLIRALGRSNANKTKITFKIEVGTTQETLVTTLCDSLGALEREELEEVLNHYDFSDYSFLKKLPKRNYRLEGYLYPAEYEMYEGESALAVVRRILDKFQEMVLTEENQKKINASSYTLDELITLASVVQCEAGSELPRAAGVYYNRLADKDFPYLQSQATVAYILPADHGAVTAADIRTDDSYNTYRNSGLPTGPIANPGAEAIAAVLEPAETEDLYFVTAGDGKTRFCANEAAMQSELKKAGENARGTGTVS